MKKIKSLMRDIKGGIAFCVILSTGVYLHDNFFQFEHSAQTMLYGFIVTAISIVPVFYYDELNKSGG